MDFQDVSPQLEKLASEFQYKDPPDFFVQFQDLVSYVFRALADFLRQFSITLPGTGDTSVIGDLMKFIIMGVGVACLIAVMFFMSKRMKHLSAQAALAKRGATSLEELLDSAGWKQKGEELARERLFKDACRAVYLGVIYALDEKKILSFTPTRSNYEYFYALHGKENLQRTFRQLADIVEEIWFGNHQADQRDYDQCVLLSDGISRDIEFWAQKVEAVK